MYTAEDQVGNVSIWEGRVQAGILAMLVFPLNYICIVVVLLITQHGLMRLTQLYRALKLLMSSTKEFKSPNPSILLHYSECQTNMVLLSPRWAIKVL